MLGQIMRAQHISYRFLGSALAAFCLLTLTWAIWGFLTPGDFFANGSKLVLPTLGIAGLIGAIVGFRISGRARIVMLVAALLSLCFWIFVPDGWWAHGP
jgi:hypothetical protein